jgi:hypothetical protein
MGRRGVAAMGRRGVVRCNLVATSELDAGARCSYAHSFVADIIRDGYLDLG